MSRAPRGPWIAVGALGFLLAVTAAWWALALWPAAGPTPEWLARTRSVCFDAGPDGMPGASGWLLLIGQPFGMLAVLMLVWGESLRGGLRALAAPLWGRLALGACALALAAGLAAAADRVASASAARAFVFPASAPLPDTYPRLDRAAPPLSLVDQRGRRVELADLHGRPALVTFAFGHCETVCPAVVKQALAARDRLRDRRSGDAARVPRVVVVSLDPWRDTPSRLPHLARHWQLDPDSLVLGGSVAEVERVLDAWKVARRRDRATGDVVHPPLFYVLDGAGRIAYASTGGTDALVELLERVRSEAPVGEELARGRS